MTKKYAVEVRRSEALRLLMNPAAPAPGEWRDWVSDSERPIAIDLFSGAGGLSLGLENAGFTVALGVDIDDWALETHAHHFKGLSLKLDLGDPNDRKGLVEFLKDVDVALVAGGPPCQPFSRAGRSKLRNLVETGQRDPMDMRRELWRAFLDVVEQVGPRAVLMENVPDMALGDDLESVRELLDRLEDLGYQADTRIVDAWVHGVPQHRQRLIIVATPSGVNFDWPEPSDRVTLRDAIGDLPVLDVRADSPVGNEHVPYGGPHSDFARRARKGCEGDEAKVVYDHVTRAVRADDLEAFRLMGPDTLYSDLPENLRRYRSDIFDDKYNRLDWDNFSRSITAHIAKDGYWYIHPLQDRTLTVREAARIQTFPDHFRFAGPRSYQFSQIGNAVPPALAEVIGASLIPGKDGADSGSGPVDLRVWRRDFRASLSCWAEMDRTVVPWAYPTDPWSALVAQIIGPSAASAWPGVEDVLALVPSLEEASPATMTALQAMADEGTRLRAVTRLARVADSIRREPDPWEDAVHSQAVDLQPSERSWLEVLGLGESRLITSTAVLRVAARVSGTNVDVTNRLSSGRLELAKLVGGGKEAALMNAAMHRLGSSICTRQDPSCSECPLRSLCSSSTA